MRSIRPSLDLLAVLAWVAIATVTAFVAVPDWARVVVDLPLVFFLPGYAIVCALRPGSLTPVERLAYSLALSLAASILTTVVAQLAFTPDREVWTIALAGVTALAACAALLRRAGVAAVGPVRRPSLPGPVAVLTLGLAVAVAVGAIAVATSGARDAESRVAFTELSILPTPATGGGHEPVAITVENRTGAPARYELNVSQAGHRLLSRSLLLEDGARWQRRVGAATPTSLHPVTATLLRHGHVYRRVYLRSGTLR